MTEQSEIIDFTTMPKEEAIKLLIEMFEYSRGEAEFYLAVAKGEILGDVLPDGSQEQDNAEISF